MTVDPSSSSTSPSVTASLPCRRRPGRLWFVRVGHAIRSIVAGLVVLFALVSLAQAVEPDEILPDAALEERARSISTGLRCLVCQNQSIDDSSAPLARDLRLIVRERLTAGDSDAQVVSFVVARYGDFVLLRPPLSLDTILLWLAPLALLIGAGLLAANQLRSRAAMAAPAETEKPLSSEEQNRLDRILERKD